MFYGVILTAINYHTMDYNLQFYTGLHTNIKLNACYYTYYQIAYLVLCWITSQSLHTPLLSTNDIVIFFFFAHKNNEHLKKGEHWWHNRQWEISVTKDKMKMDCRGGLLIYFLHSLTALFFTHIMLHQIEVAQTPCECKMLNIQQWSLNYILCVNK